jgi:hypothetical protein
MGGTFKKVSEHAQGAQMQNGNFVEPTLSVGRISLLLSKQ